MNQDDHHHHMMVHSHRDVAGGTARAVIFGISDGLVSNVALILGVAAATSEGSGVVVAGVAGLLAGAASMAAGEYVSVKAQVELIERELAIERDSIASKPKLETQELASIYRRRGVSAEHAHVIATAVMADPEVALEVHAREELGIDPDSGGGNPVAAAAGSFVAFSVGAALPLLPWFITSGVAGMVASVIIGLVAAGAVGVTLAWFTERSWIRTAIRQISLAAGACALTWVIGSLVGSALV